jgi:hypothetical protein
MTQNAAKRILGHRKTSAWWDLVARVDYVPYASRDKAIRAERAAILEEKPLHNRQEYAADVRPHRYADGCLMVRGVRLDPTTHEWVMRRARAWSLDPGEVIRRIITALAEVEAEQTEGKTHSRSFIFGQR